MVTKQDVWDSILKSNVYPEYKCRKIFNNLGYDAKRKFYRIAEYSKENYITKSKEIDIHAFKPFKFEGGIKTKRKIGSKFIMDISFTGDVKYNSQFNSEMAIVGIISQIKENDLMENINRRQMAKWIIFPNSRVFIDFKNWITIPLVDDYYIYPSKVNDYLYSPIQYDHFVRKNKIHKRDRLTNYFRISEKFYDYFNQISTAWINLTPKIVIETNDGVRQSSQSGDMFTVGMHIPILILANNPKLFTLLMEEYESKDANYEKLLEVPFFVYNSQISPGNLKMLLERDMSILGMHLPMVVTTYENLSSTIKKIESGLKSNFSFN